MNETDRLSTVSFDAPFGPRSFGVFAARDRHLTPAARRFLEVLAPDVPALRPLPPRGGRRTARGDDGLGP